MADFTLDGYTSADLTIAVNKLPQTTMVTEDLGIFEINRIKTTKVGVKVKNGRIIFIDDTNRDADAIVAAHEGENIRTFETLHLPLAGHVRPSDIQNISSEAVNVLGHLGMGGDPVATALNNEMQRLKNNLRVMREYHRINALKGKLCNKSGAAFLDFYAEFNVQKNATVVDFGDKTLEVADIILDAIRLGESKLEGQFVTGWAAFCGKTFLDKLRRHPSIASAIKNTPAAPTLVLGDVRKGFPVSGVMFREVDGMLAGRKFVDDDKCHIFPIGGSGILVENLAPANYNWAVNTPGLDYYASIETRKHNKGSEVEVQTNPLPICTYPEALTELSVKP
jgi:hypothetical protein